MDTIKPFVDRPNVMTNFIPPLPLVRYLCAFKSHMLNYDLIFNIRGCVKYRVQAYLVWVALRLGTILGRRVQPYEARPKAGKAGP